MTMKDPSVPSSSRGLAHELIQRIGSRKNAPSKTAAPSSPKYADLAAAGQAIEALWARAARRPAATTSFESWESLLAWAIDICHASIGFVVNSEGFVIANWGDAESTRVDGLGADLCLALDELERTDPGGGRLQTVCLRFEMHWVIALRTSHGESSAFTVGLISNVLLIEQLNDVLDAIANSIRFVQ